jgi:hypothetical protein
VGDWFIEAAKACVKEYPCGYTSDATTKKIIKDVSLNCVSCWNAKGASGGAVIGVVACQTLGKGHISYHTVFTPND